MVINNNLSDIMASKTCSVPTFRFISIIIHFTWATILWSIFLWCCKYNFFSSFSYFCSISDRVLVSTFPNRILFSRFWVILTTFHIIAARKFNFFVAIQIYSVLLYFILIPDTCPQFVMTFFVFCEDNHIVCVDQI